jgi:DivIVA domain-containing protein
MDLLLLLLAVGLVGVVAAVATGRIRGGLDEPTRGRPDRALPDGPLSGRDIERMRFSLAARGYRMDEVDETLDRLRAELDARDARIATLTAQLGGVLDRPAGDLVDDRVDVHDSQRQAGALQKAPDLEKPADEGRDENPPANRTT